MKKFTAAFLIAYGNKQTLVWNNHHEKWCIHTDWMSELMSNAQWIESVKKF